MCRAVFFAEEKSEKEKSMQKSEKEYSKKILEKSKKEKKEPAVDATAGSMLKKCFVKA